MTPPTLSVARTHPRPQRPGGRREVQALRIDFGLSVILLIPGRLDGGQIWPVSLPSFWEMSSIESQNHLGFSVNRRRQNMKIIFIRQGQSWNLPCRQHNSADPALLLLVEVCISSSGLHFGNYSRVLRSKAQNVVVLSKRLRDEVGTTSSRFSTIL